MSPTRLFALTTLALLLFGAVQATMIGVGLWRGELGFGYAMGTRRC